MEIAFAELGLIYDRPIFAEFTKKKQSFMSLGAAVTELISILSKKSKINGKLFQSSLS